MFNGDESGERQQRMQLASMARRRKAKERINKENREMLQRIVNVKATFTRQAWKSEEKRRKKLKQNLRQNSMNRQGNSPRYTPRVTPRITPRVATKKKKGSTLIRPKTAPARSSRRQTKKKGIKKSSLATKTRIKVNNSNNSTTTRMKRPQSARTQKKTSVTKSSPDEAAVANGVGGNDNVKVASEPQNN
jgi:hypothetical protein